MDACLKSVAHIRETQKNKLPTEDIQAVLSFMLEEYQHLRELIDHSEARIRSMLRIVEGS